MAFFEFPHTRTYDADLGWLIKNFKTIVETVEGLEAWRAQFEEEYQELLDFYNQILSGQIPEGMEQAINNWMQRNALNIVGELVKMVFFGITQDGYFVAYIPEGWDDIIFNTTGYDISIPDIDFGHLTLSFEIGGI